MAVCCQFFGVLRDAAQVLAFYRHFLGDGCLGQDAVVNAEAPVGAVVIIVPADRGYGEFEGVFVRVADLGGDNAGGRAKNQRPC